MAVIGEYNEDLKLFLETYRSRTIASKQSAIDIRTEITTKGKGVLETGKMYSFEYYTTEETFYDTNPIVLGLGESDNGHQLGINLHYMPYEARLPFMELVVKAFKRFPQFKGATDVSVQKQRAITSFTWEFLKRSFNLLYTTVYD